MVNRADMVRKVRGYWCACCEEYHSDDDPQAKPKIVNVYICLKCYRRYRSRKAAEECFMYGKPLPPPVGSMADQYKVPIG